MCAFVPPVGASKGVSNGDGEFQEFLLHIRMLEGHLYKRAPAICANPCGSYWAESSK
ncbi:hypothetical protein DPX39_010023700 [Trypanosoma brucei equiperdum]|uniref:Uncharacterized protein n=1 Tax=Trypanosoma brucei equiperdum TaxID=630700 RepID=A0A3L6LCJ4_9TRYP|nr:hypothetical protein DPX39_010023700 [Trypanosoma brucei equiperdum]